MFFEVTSFQIEELLRIAVDIRDILEEFCVILKGDQRDETSYFLNRVDVLLNILRVTEIRT